MPRIESGSYSNDMHSIILTNLASGGKSIPSLHQESLIKIAATWGKESSTAAAAAAAAETAVAAETAADFLPLVS